MVSVPTNPMLVRAMRGLDQLNRRHPWSHNEHFHGWILRNLPARRHVALDVGCGRGLLAGRLSSRFASVIAIDADEGMAAEAATRCRGNPCVTVRHCGFDDFASTAGDGELDVITMVAVLHHLDLNDSLARIPRLLSPGGRLLVVGLATVDSLAGLAIDGFSAIANPVVGMVKHPRRSHPPADPAHERRAMPVKDPTTTWTDVTTVARTHLPGASIRRRLFFRYTLRWDKQA